MKRIRSLVAVSIAAALLVSACGSDSADPGTSGGAASDDVKTLVVNDAFDLKTSDPARAFELTGTTVDHAIYETALNYDGADVKKIVPGICSYTISDDNKVLTLTLEGTHTFSDGSPVTADDIVFSYQRVLGIAGNPSFLLDGVTAAKVDDKTVTLTSKTGNPQLPFILPNPSLGIVNSKVVKENGGTTDTKDAAENFLNTTSAGSGPYMIDTYDVQSQVVFKLNPSYASTKPAYGRVVMSNVPAATQKVNIQAGTAQVAFSLSPDDIASLDTSKTKVMASASTTTIFMWFNMDAAFGKTAADAKFVQAMRHAINYADLLKLAGTGSAQPGGLVPLSFLGALDKDDNNAYDVDKAKSLLAESKYQGEEIAILYSSDVAIGGVKIGDVAQAIEQQAAAIGVKLKLNPQPSSTSLDSFRSGKAQAGVAYWGADYPDPADYLVFAPGQSLGKRAAWAESMAPDSTKLATAAAEASGDDARAAAYVALQKQLNVEGPFIPLFQPADNTVVSSSLSNVVVNPIWGLDFASIS